MDGQRLKLEVRSEEEIFPRFQSSIFSLQSSRSGITMVELLVVIVIIAILIGAVLTAGSALIGRSKINNTRALLQVVSDACEEFKREQSTRPTLAAAHQAAANPQPNKPEVKYRDRYGEYPPDELEVFTKDGLPGSRSTGSSPTGNSLARNAVMSPGNKYNPMDFYNTGVPDHDAQEHRDLAAMIVAIELYGGDMSQSILGRIPEKNRTAGMLDASGNPAQFLDRGPSGSSQPDGKWGPEDLQIRYIVDEWGNPLSYLAQRDFVDKPGAINHPSNNHALDWNEASTELIRMNSGQPIVFSYGPDGKEQLTKDAMGNDAAAPAAASLVGDFESDTPAHHIVDNPMNADNVYSGAGLAEKLAKGLATP